MGENTFQIEQEIGARRQVLGRHLDELEGKARELADWRTHFKDHPGVFLGLAAGAGFALALAIPRPQSRVRDQHSLPQNRVGAAMLSHKKQAMWSGSAARVKTQVADTWDQIADALLSAASAKAIQVVGEIIPGFREHLRPAKASGLSDAEH